MPAKTGLGNSPQHTLRGPHPDIWDAAANRAASYGETRNAAIVRLLTEYAAGQHPPPPTDDTARAGGTTEGKT